MKRNTPRTNSSIRVISNHYCCPASTYTSSASRSNYYTSYRSKSKHFILRSRRRGGPSSIPTPILILRSPRSLHPHPPRFRNNFPRSSILCRKKRTIRIHRNSLSHTVNRIPWLHCMSPPYIHSRNGRRHPSLLYISHNNHRHPNWY